MEGMQMVLAMVLFYLSILLSVDPAHLTEAGGGLWSYLCVAAVSVAGLCSAFWPQPHGAGSRGRQMRSPLLQAKFAGATSGLRTFPGRSSGVLLRVPPMCAATQPPSTMAEAAPAGTAEAMEQQEQVLLSTP